MKKEKKIIVLNIAVCVGLIISCLISAFSSLDNACDDIKENVFRLHIIANSDSSDDQELKIKIRDAVLEASGEMFTYASSSYEAEKISEKELVFLEKTARDTIHENGFDYEAKIEIGESYFPTREYGTVTLPAGKYRALRIVLGEGKGHNWWCVMFPPMCLSAAYGEEMLDDVLNEEAFRLVSSGKKYEVKFKIVEWYESVKNSLTR